MRDTYDNIASNLPPPCIPPGQRASGVADRRPKQPLQARRAFFEDYEQIAALHFRNGLTLRSRDEWIAFWLGNPASRERLQSPIGWVLETLSRDIVGWVGNILSLYQFKGRRLHAATPWSWMVDEQHRGYGMLILKRFLRQKDVDFFLCNNVSPVSDPFARRLRFFPVPVGTWDKSAFWITNHSGFAQIALRMKSVPMATAVAYPVGAALMCWDWCKDKWARGHQSITGIQLCSEFDHRFDDFWDELLHQNEDALLAVRTRETLEWHFRSALTQRRLWILTTHQGSRLTAYAIFDRRDNPEIGLRRVRLVDFQAHQGSESALVSALSWMLHHCREDQIHILEVSGCWLDRPGLPRIVAPYRRTMPSWSYYYKAPDPTLSAQLRDPRIWAPSSFDGDTSL